MAETDRLRHIRLDGYAETQEFTTPGGGGAPKIFPRNREEHGQFILDEISRVQKWYADQFENDLAPGLEQDRIIYLEIHSEPDYKLAYDKLDRNRDQFELRYSKRVSLDEGKHHQYRALVMVSEEGLARFERIGNEYLKKETPKTKQPKHNELIANISAISVANVKSFWNELPGTTFPGEDETIWWEVWIRRKPTKDIEYELGRVITQIESVGGIISEKEIRFPEHIIRFVKSTPKQLEESIMKLEVLAELRKPRDTADFFTEMGIIDREDWVKDIQNRIEIGANEDSVAICILDSGVNNKHVLLSDFLPDDQMGTINPAWGTADSMGHGTPMAGLALYGDLMEHFASTDRIRIFHQLESVKLLNSTTSNAPEFYGPNTELAAAIAELKDPFRPRIFCMAISATDGLETGRPSSWSASLDKICFGIDEGEKRLFFVSGGNLPLEELVGYPDANELSALEDPAQAYNAITVGAFTEKDQINEDDYGDLETIAERNDLSPFSRTSLTWESAWPIKPEIVMEGGNAALEGGSALLLDSLQLLSTDRDPRIKMLSPFNATSAATALASRMAAQIFQVYPDYWPETIRGLMIHSAIWTDRMLNGSQVSQLGHAQKITLLRKFGYGVPILDKALYSAKNNLTLIVQEELQPYKYERRDKTNEMHFFKLPWPKEALSQIGDEEVVLNITLSYFIEPSPGDRQFTTKFHYQSHGLRFNINGPNETEDEFRRRINVAERNSPRDKAETSAESWTLKRLRNNGSVHRDMWIGTAADLAERNLVAIYPVNGWYRKRKDMGRVNEVVRYSLIVSIEAPAVNVDLYTPIATPIGIDV